MLCWFWFAASYRDFVADLRQVYLLRVAMEITGRFWMSANSPQIQLIYVSVFQPHLKNFCSHTDWILNKSRSGIIWIFP